MKHKNPFRGVACRSPRKLKDERHVEGARDESPTWRLRDTEMAEFRYRNPNPTPACFTGKWSF